MKRSRPSRHVGAYEAKTRLAELLRDAENGTAFVIRRRGKDVARLVPPDDRPDAARLAALKAEMRSLRKSVRGILDVTALKREGRR